MNNIVIELQKECLDDSSKVASIIRKAYVIAKKLEINDLAVWAQNELNGYSDDISIYPDYREVNVEYRAFNPYRGWIPVMIPSKSDFAFLLKQKVSESIEQIETLLGKSDGQISFRVNDDVQQAMNSGASADFEIKGFIGKIQFVGILKAVRNIVLDWTLKLEKNGIIGAGMSFTPEEKSKAATGIVNYGTIVYGNIEDSQVISGTGNTQEMSLVANEIQDIEKIIDIVKSNLQLIGLEDKQKSEVETNIQNVETEIKTTKRKSKIIGALSSLKTIFEGVSGNIIASGILYEISKYLPK